MLLDWVDVFQIVHGKKPFEEGVQEHVEDVQVQQCDVEDVQEHVQDVQESVKDVQDQLCDVEDVYFLNVQHLKKNQNVMKKYQIHFCFIDLK